MGLLIMTLEKSILDRRKDWYTRRIFNKYETCLNCDSSLEYKNKVNCQTYTNYLNPEQLCKWKEILFIDLNNIRYPDYVPTFQKNILIMINDKYKSTSKIS